VHPDALSTGRQVSLLKVSLLKASRLIASDFAFACWSRQRTSQPGCVTSRPRLAIGAIAASIGAMACSMSASVFASLIRLRLLRSTDFTGLRRKRMLTYCLKFCEKALAYDAIQSGLIRFAALL
jgi:hypothetical protein